MEPLPLLIVLVAAAVVVGALAVAVLVVVRATREQEAVVADALAELRQEGLAELREQAAADRDAAVRAAVSQLDLLAGERAGAERRLLEQSLSRMGSELTKVTDLVGELEQRRAASHGALSQQLQETARVTGQLGQTTQALREALASSKARGQWGERMAEDVLRLAGFVEGVNYHKQRSVEGGRGIPDFTFELPKGHVLYMDAKFPVSAYLRYLEATADVDRDRRRSEFLRDVRQRVKELSTREYAAGGGRPCVDYVLLFIPNESVYGFIHEQDPSLLDDALGQRVVFCSPLTLFAMLAVIRQAFDNFVVERTSDEILRLLGAFAQQWDRFASNLDGVGRKLDTAQKAFDELNGTRRRQLEKPLAKIEELRRQKGLAADPALSPGAEILPLDSREPWDAEAS